MRFHPTVDSFMDLLSIFKKTAKQAFGDKTNKRAETFLFPKLPVQHQNDLAVDGKHGAATEEIKVLVQRQRQYPKLMPTNSTMQPINQLK